ncbi:MAG: hypothetical protein H7838_02285 [Magnetococcus sp. DMHC-8]
MSHLPSRADPFWGPSTCQIAEDWLFAYANARHDTARASMWPHLVEAVEELIAESRHLYARQTSTQ